MTVLLGEIEHAADGRERRGQDRLTVRLGLWSEDRDRRALIYNLSRSGMLLRIETELAEGDGIEVELPAIGKIRACVVRVAEASLYGCEFDPPISQAAVSAALLEGGYHMHQIVSE